MIHNLIKSNAYFDSVTLMLFSSKLNSVNGIEEAAVMMGTNHNIDLMINSGLLSKEQASKITSNDLVIGIKGKDKKAIDEAIKVLNEQFENKNTISNDSKSKVVKNIDAAINEVSDLNLAVISVPGRFAKNEAMKCLKKNMHVLLFSDNVSIDEENELKSYAVKNNLLMMGPDCGTAIINGVALGFANVITKGNIGIVAASGTGLQEVTVIIDKLGGGISQAIGTGGRDVKSEIGGKMMLLGLEALNQDPETKIIGIISKPPAKEVMEKILSVVKNFKKPVVVCFLGGNQDSVKGTQIEFAENLQEAARKMVKLSGKLKNEELINTNLESLAANLNAKQFKDKFVRGFYSGGTLAYETMLILSKQIGIVYSNIAVDKKLNLVDVEKSQGHTIIDMGEDYFTDGMPHPMIDPTQRNNRLQKEASMNETGIVLFDCVLGYGSHEDPASTIVKSITHAKAKNPNAIFIGSVCGTDKDFQNRLAQESLLKKAGAIVLPTNAQAAMLASILVKKARG